MTQVLFISRSLVGPDYHGGCVYPDAVLRFLAANDCEIHYLWLADAISSARPMMKAPALGDYVSSLHVPGAINAGRWLFARRVGDWLRLPIFLGQKLLQKTGILRTAAAGESHALATPE